MPALSADPAVREQAFARFQDVEEPRSMSHGCWKSLRYLNHPYG